MKNSYIWISIYWLLLGVNIVSNLLAYSLLANGTKVLLMPTLFGLLMVNVPFRGSKIFIWTSIALFFSWMGDILLIFQDKSAMYFLFGLGVFLIAHLSYVIDYRVSRYNKVGLDIKGWILPVALLLIYLVSLFMGIGPGLNEYTIPVVLYAVAISGMFLSAYSRAGGTARKSFRLVLIGAMYIYIIRFFISYQ